MAGLLAQPLNGTAQAPSLPNTIVQASALPTSTTSVNLAQANAVAPTSVQATTPSTIALNQQTDTMAGQMGKLIDPNSPIMQRAAARANEMSNSRGLLNSSMAVGAAQGAVMDAAAPIAQNDANAFRTTAIANADMTNQANQFNAQQQNATNLSTAQMQTDVNKVNTQQQNAVVMNQLDQANKVQLADIQAAYQNQIQANASSSALFDKSMTAITTVQQDPNMSAAAKQRTINHISNLLSSGLNLTGSIANLNLGGLINFSYLN